MEEHIIWDSSPDFDDWEDDLREEYPDASEEELVNIMYETNNDYLDDERANLRDIETCVFGRLITMGQITICFAHIARR